MPVLDIIHFTDHGSGDAAFVLVRVAGTTVDLTLSLQSDGDLAVFFGLAELERLIQTLQEAHRQLQQPQSPPREQSGLDAAGGRSSVRPDTCTTRGSPRQPVSDRFPCMTTGVA